MGINYGDDTPTPAEAPAEAPAPEVDPIGSVPVEDATDDVTPTAPVPAAASVNRRGRGGLEASVKAVCDAYSEGNLVLSDGELLTPHRIRKEIAKREGVNEPSGGAVSNILAKWSEIGAAEVNDKPLAFVSYTDAAVDDGISALKQKARDAKKGTTVEPNPTAEATAGVQTPDVGEGGVTTESLEDEVAASPDDESPIEGGDAATAVPFLNESVDTSVDEW